MNPFLPSHPACLIPWSFTEPCWFEVQHLPLSNDLAPSQVLLIGSMGYTTTLLLQDNSPRKLRWLDGNSTMCRCISYWKRWIFQCHVSFRGCMHWACYFPHWYPNHWFYQHFRIAGTTSYRVSFQDAGNSKILRCFESRSTGLAQDLLAPRISIW